VVPADRVVDMAAKFVGYLPADHIDRSIHVALATVRVDIAYAA
jgi:hypothetical protein